MRWLDPLVTLEEAGPDDLVWQSEGRAWGGRLGDVALIACGLALLAGFIAVLVWAA